MTNNRKPSLAYHYRANAIYHWDGPDGSGGWENDDVTVEVRATVKLLTGGKSSVARKSLFCIDGGATRNGWRLTTYGANWTAVDIADKTSLQVLDKPLGARRGRSRVDTEVVMAKMRSCRAHCA